MARTYLRDGRAPIPKSEATSRVMSANKGKGTKPELLLRKALWQNDIKGYRLNWKKAPGRPDIAFPGRNIAIFINGCFWHRCEKCKPSFPKSNIEFWKEKFHKNIVRDRVKKEQLLSLEWQVITVWECEIKDDMSNVLKNIKKHFF